jgi:hypothetical protein
MAFVQGQTVWAKAANEWVEAVVYEVFTWDKYLVWTMNNDLVTLDELEIRPYFFNVAYNPDKFGVTDPRRD